MTTPKEGWITEHPATGRAVEVVTAAYNNDIEWQAAQSKAVATSLLTKVEQLEKSHAELLAACNESLEWLERCKRENAKIKLASATR